MAQSASECREAFFDNKMLVAPQYCVFTTPIRSNTVHGVSKDCTNDLSMKKELNSVQAHRLSKHFSQP